MMAFNRTNEYEHHSGEKSSLEDSLTEALAKAHERPASLADYIQASLGKSAYVNNKYTVADMVKDLINRTGLKEYVRSVEADFGGNGTEKKAYPNMPSTPQGDEPKTEIEFNINVNGPTQSEPAEGLSLLDAPDVSKNIKNYINSYGAYQAASVIDYVRTELRKNLPTKFAEIDPNFDPKLIKFIQDNLKEGPDKSVKEPPTAESTEGRGEVAPAFEFDKKEDV
jgi:hypothetical protein